MQTTTKTKYLEYSQIYFYIDEFKNNSLKEKTNIFLKNFKKKSKSNRCQRHSKRMNKMRNDLNVKNTNKFLHEKALNYKNNTM